MDDADARTVSGSSTRATTAASKLEQDSIQVLVRVRPLHDIVSGYDNYPGSGYEGGGDHAAIDIMSANTLAVANTDGKRMFNCTYDHVLGPQSTQDDVYNTVSKCTTSVIEGFNATIFAYGQTGSGKTFSMYGPPNEYGNRSMQNDRSLIGVIPRAVQEIFDLSEKQDVIQVSVYVSFVQIYNEQLFDMLRDASMVSPLTIREDQGREIYVQGLSEYNVKSVSDTLQLLKIAEDNRTVRETHMNQFSSRSHSIFQIYVEQKRLSPEDGGEVYLRAKYNLVDLAGSEKWNLSKQMRDEHVTEMTNINLSLHTLGRCISSLAQRSLGKDLHIPFRDSKLTRLLQDSLGGNARTYLLATVSPLKANVEETISTLKFADNAKRVMVQAIMNETRPVDHAMVKRLQTEVERLRGLLRMAGLDVTGLSTGGPDDPQSQDLALRQAQVASEAGVNVVTSQQPMAVGNLAGINLLTSLEGALLQEQEKVGKFRGENDRLKKELKRLSKSEPSAGGDVNMKSMLKENVVIPINAAKDAAMDINTVFQSQQAIWAEVNRMKQTVKKFFRFELEEEALRKNFEESFATLNVIQAKEGEGMSRPNTKVVLKSLSECQMGQASLNSPTQVQPIGNHGLKRGAQSRIKSNQNGTINKENLDSNSYEGDEQQADGGGPFLPHTPSPNKSIKGPSASMSPNIAQGQGLGDIGFPAIGVGDQGAAAENGRKLQQQQQLQQQQYQRQQQQQQQKGSLQVQISKKDGRYAEMPSSPVQTGEESESFGNEPSSRGQHQQQRKIKPHTAQQKQQQRQHQQQQAPQQQPQQLRQLKIPRNNGSAPRQAQCQSEKPQQVQQQPQQLIRHPSQPDMQAPSSANANPGFRTPGGGIAMRVRGSTDSTNSEWIDTASQRSEVEEEAVLQKELKKAKKKLQKQQQLQDWLREKESRAMEAQQVEEEERRAVLEAELAKEAKRKDYVRKQKEKLTGYKSMIKQEAHQIQELVDLGIDPTSLF